MEELDPFTALLQGVLDGSIGLNEGRRAIPDMARTGVIEFADALALCAMARSEAYQDAAWRKCLLAAELCYEATRVLSKSQDEAMEAWQWCGVFMIDIMHIGLLEHGDLRLYLRASKVEQETTQQRTNSLRPLRAALSLAWGTLLVDSYTSNRTPSNYHNEHAMWLERALHRDDPELAYLPDSPAGAAWPQPLDGLRMAADHLELALSALSDHEYMVALKALVQAVEWQGYIGGVMDTDRLRDLAVRALRVLPDDFVTERAGMAALLQHLGEEQASEEPAAQIRLIEEIERDWAGFSARHTPNMSWEVLGRLAPLVGHRIGNGIRVACPFALH